MTTFGKILVFVNLVFSLLVCALMGMVYFARTNWADAYRKQEQLYKSSHATAEAYASELKTVYDETRLQLQASDAIIKKQEKELEDRRSELKAAQDTLKDLGIVRNKADTSVTKLQSDVMQRSEESKKREEDLVAALSRNTELTQQVNHMRGLKTAAEIENKTLRDHNQNLVAKLEEMQKDMARMRATGGTTPSRAAVNPPAGNVEGIVKNTDPSGLVTISIGSDAGLQRGHTLEVYRLSPSPAYLGTIRIQDTRSHEAVGQPIGTSRPRVPIQVGDRVSSRIQLDS